MKLTQEELANKLGLQKSAIAKYENGRVENIKRSVISDMATILECSPSYLMGWEDTLSDESTDLEYEMSHDKLLRDFYFYWKQLSDIGKKKIIDNVSDLAKIYKNDTE